MSHLPHHPFFTVLQKAREHGHTAVTMEMANSLKRSHHLDFSGVERVSRLVERGEIVSNGVLYGGARGLTAEARIGLWLAGQRVAGASAAISLPAPEASLTASQRSAWAFLGASLPVSARCLTGLPGTGKTWLICRWIEALTKRGAYVSIAAPTGKAASVLYEKLERLVPVSTVHRLLGWRPGMDPTSFINADYLIVDESSMLDAEMLGHLVTACLPSTQIILVGDPHQIPPVGPGSPFIDLLSVLPVSTLTEIQRQQSGNGILHLAHAAADGKLYIPERNVYQQSVPSELLDEAAQQMYCSGRYGGVKDVVILSAIRKESYEASVGTINHGISHALHPDRTLGRSKFTKGDRLMFTVNNYQHGFVNGELGVLQDYHKRQARIVNDSGKEYIIDDYGLGQHAEWAYAMTIHKAQGSECRTVILLLHPRMRFMYSRNLLYTAITRAREELIVLGEWGVLRDGLQHEEKRVTLLPWLMEQPEVCRRILDYGTPPDLSGYI